ncbi:MAG: hypothetical protein JNL80_12050 [Phycisphaerae bacterium]|nr:hypothetical protein [Phycisphaerae bacterium]
MPELTSPQSFLSRPLFRVDPGWPFVLAGLALLIAGILIPAQRELHELRGQQALVEASESRVYARLEAYDRFLTDLRSNEPDLIRRLAIAHLNMVPKGEQSLLLTPGLDQSVAQWIDESVPEVTLQPEPYPDTLLGRLAVGPNRLWLMAASVFLLFVGMLLGPDTARPLPVMPRREAGDADDARGGSGSATAVADADPMADHDATMNESQTDADVAGGRLAALGVIAADSCGATDEPCECATATMDEEPACELPDGPEVIDVEVVEHAADEDEVEGPADVADDAEDDDEFVAEADGDDDDETTTSRDLRS